MITNELRSYEISLWTLLDDFITVLKWSNIELEGRIRGPEMKINIDGTLTLNFSIPMYLYTEVHDENLSSAVRVEKKENPIWYNTKNGNLITGLRKLKVIFNKWTELEKVFEFLITKVSESHEKDLLICNVESEGLAFHELGKIGYKISLSLDTYTLDKKDYDEKGHWTKKDGTQCLDEPLQTVQYWCELCDLVPVPSGNALLNSTVWYYDIQMNWQSFGNKVLRDSDKVYEDEYVSSWNGNLAPLTIESAREKARPINVKESNIYNITQTIAETFKIYCCYEYGYDENYHIISRKVIFYNNYLNENDMLSFTYPYSASQITRDMDATELVTKMYVLSLDSAAVVSGLITIADCSANKTKEDYLLNFDYLYTIGAITLELYDAIPEFEKAIRALNIELESLSLLINTLEDIKIRLDALKSVYQTEVEKALELINYNSQLYDKLGAKEGLITRGETHPYSTLIRTDANGRTYIALGDENPGVFSEPNNRNIHIYKSFDSAVLALADTWTTWTASTEYGIGAKVVVVDGQNNSKTAYTCIEAHTSDSSFQEDKWVKQSSWKEWKPQTDYAINLLVFIFELSEDQNYYKAYVCKAAHKSGNSFDDSKWIPNLIDDLIDWNNIVYDSTTPNNSYVKELVLPTNPFNNNDILKTVYLTYQYNPKLYCDAVNRIYVDKQNDALDLLDSAIAAYNAAVTTLETLSISYKNKLIEKNQLIQKFNRMMGPALREGYWLPENEYQDYGNHKVSTDKSLSTIISSPDISEDAQDDIIINWDVELFEDEDKIYFEEGVLKNKIYYPCIDLSNYMGIISKWLKANKTITFFFRNNYYKDIVSGEENYVENYTQFVVGGGALLGFVADDNENVIPVLILTGSKDMTDEQINFMLNPNKGCPKLGIINIEKEDNSNNYIVNLEESITDNPIIFNNNYIVYWKATTIPSTTVNNLYNNSYLTVYPRIKFSDNNLSTNSIVIKYGNELLENYNDYLLTSRTTTRNNASYFEYFITIKPKVLFKYGYGSNHTFTVDYTLSNAATCIYLDALNVMADSSKPKASYTIKINALNRDYLHIAYNSLGQIIMVNDTDLKFENVFGYISELKLKLDKPQEDEFEVKNYKTKFEDLFSTIVAQSEAMRKNGSSFEAAANGEVPLNSEALADTINQNYSIMQAYLDSSFDSSQVVKDKLAEIFTEAAQILGCANLSIDAVKNLNIKNASILAGFVQNVSQDLTPTVVTSQTLPTNFKVGDIWNLVDSNGNVIGRYVATTGSSSAAGGFTKTFDGTLAAITGAALNIDAVNGKVEILALNKIDMKSGGNIYIAANENVDIVGNKAVNIGGTTVNIAAASLGGEVGGINIVSSSYNESINNATSKVLIHPDMIDMSSADIVMKGGKKILSVASNGTSSGTSAILISATDGIWLGSGNGIVLYSGEASFSYNDSSKTLSVLNSSKASIELLPHHLLFGVSDNLSGSAAEFTKEYIVLGNGGEGSLGGNITGVSGTLVGAKFTKNSIGFAIRNNDNNTINAILMNDKGVTVGSGVNVTSTTDNLKNTSGSYVRIASDGINIGSLANLYINSNNFKLLTDTYNKNNNTQRTVLEDTNTVLAIGDNLLSVDQDTAYDPNYKTLKKKIGNSYTDLATIPTVKLLLNQNGLYINGTVYASDGSFTGDVTAKKLIANGGLNNSGYGPIFVVDGAYLGIFKLDSNFTTLPASLASVPDANKLFWFDSTTGNMFITGRLVTNGINIDGTSWNDYFNNEKASWMGDVNSNLNNLFDKVGKLIGASQQSLSDLNSINVGNNLILSNFKTDLKTMYTPIVYKGPYHGPFFKVGDIWKCTAENSISTSADGHYNITSSGKQKSSAENPYESSTVLATYVATSNWQENYPNMETDFSGASPRNSNRDKLSSKNGWNKVSATGLLAAIEGTGIKIDAEAGTIDISSTSSITLASKLTMNLASQLIDITGTESINIGGPSIKIASYTNGILNESNAGITLTSTYNSYTDEDGIFCNGGTSIVSLTTKGIELASRNGILIRSVHGIKIYANDIDGDTTAAVEISRDKGVWIGSGKSVLLSAKNSQISGSSFSMTPERILMGVTEVDENIPTSTSVIDINKNLIILAVGSSSNTISDYTSGNITGNTTLSGVLIKSNYIGLATGTGTSTSAYRSLISITPTQILIGVAKKGTVSGAVNVTDSNFTESNVSSQKIIGGYVKIGLETSNGNTVASFEVGSTGIFKVLTPTFMLNNAAASGSDMLYIANNGSWSDATSGIKFTNNSNGGTLAIKGNIVATGFELGSNVTIPYASISGKPNLDDYKVNGVGWTTWNSQKYVSLTARANGDGEDDGDACAGILIGYSDSTLHLIVPYSASNSRTVVDISRGGIYFDHFDSAPENSTVATNYIHMDTNGIDVKGSRIKINNNEVWARDDIVILKKYNSSSATWDMKTEWIEYKMRNASDWVLIKPYYDATINYLVTLNSRAVITTSTMSNQYQDFITVRKADILLSLGGSTSEKYKYEFKFFTYAEINLPISSIALKIGNEIFTTNDNNLTYAINEGGSSGGAIPGENSAYQTRLTFRSNNNYAADGEDSITILIKIACDPAGSGSLYYFNVRLDRGYTFTASADTTTSRVPCTTYYYPSDHPSMSTPTGYLLDWPNY